MKYFDITNIILFKMSMNCDNYKCYNIENIIYDDLCNECKTITPAEGRDVLNKCNIIKDGHNFSTIIISDMLITYYQSDNKIKVEQIKLDMNLTDIRKIDFGSDHNNNFVIIMICKQLITINDIWKQINKQLLNRLFKNRLLL